MSSFAATSTPVNVLQTSTVETSGLPETITGIAVSTIIGAVPLKVPIVFQVEIFMDVSRA